MFSEFNNNFKEFIVSIFETKKDSILDPLTCIIRLSILEFKPIGTKISLNNNKIKYNDPSAIQGALRWSNGDNREDLHNLFNPLKKAVLWYDIKNPEIKNIINYSIRGLEKLQSSYNKNTVISHSMQYYINYLKLRLDNKNNKDNKDNKDINLLSEEENENTISKQLRDLWSEREISIINNLILELEDNRKYNKPQFLQEQEALIRTMEIILNRKEQKVSDILLENTTLLS
jgi:hypothetical protein